jgi:tetratricopeptide (TPR) repeat protein
MKRAITILAIPLLAVALVACGPKSGKTPEVPIGKDGKPISGAKGGPSEVSKKVREDFKTVVESFEAHQEAGDWTPEICEDLEKQFRKVNKDTEKETGLSLVKAIYNVGVVWQECGEHKNAWSAFDEAIKLDRQNNEGKITYQPPIIQQGTYKLKLYLKDGKTKDLNEARSKFKQAIDLDPLSTDVVQAYINLALIQRLEADGNTKAYKEALKNLQRALVIDSKNLDAFLQMAELYREQAAHEKDDSKIDLAVLVLSQAQLIEAEKGTKFAPLNLSLGLLKMERGDIIGALKNFESAYTKDEDLFEAYMNFGAITIGFRGYEDAEMVFGRALELRPENYEAHINLGVAQRGLEKYDEAEKQYLKAIDIEPNRPDAYFNLGLLYQDYYYEKAGETGWENYKIAIDWYEKFKQKAGTQKDYTEKVESADERIANSQKAIDLMKEAAALMAEAEAMEAEAAAMEEEAPAEEPPVEEGESAEGEQEGGSAEAEGGGEDTEKAEEKKEKSE